MNLFRSNFVVFFFISLLFLGSSSLFSMTKSDLPELKQSTLEYDEGPLTVTDGLGYEMTFLSPPESIASLTLFADEVLFSLVDSQRLSAITFLAEDPQYSNVSHRASEVDVKLEFNVEALLEIYPDILFVADWSDPAKVVQLRNLGIPVYQIRTPRNIQEIQEEILKIGRIVNAYPQAEDIVNVMNHSLQFTEDRLSSLEESQIKTALDYNSWGTSMGSDSTWNDILVHSRVRNGVSPYEEDQLGQVPLSKELIVIIDPDILFVPQWIYGEPQGAELFYQQLMEDPSLAGIKAVRENQVFQMPEHLKSTYSQYIVEAVRYIAVQVYPEQF